MIMSDIENILLIGISYKTASVEYREKFSFSKETVPKALKNIKKINGVNECIVLSTCNRTELYIVGEKSTESIRESIFEYILTATGMDKDFLEFFYSHTGVDAINHLFRTTCGLDSIIIGEPQIFGQVKNAYALACDNRSTGPVLNRLFHTAFQVGKKVRSSTSINKGIVSISSAAVMLGKKVYGSLRGCNALLIGTGKIGKMCAKQMADSGIANLYITNRTHEIAVDLAEELSGISTPYENMQETFEKVDIIITSVTSSKPVITKENLSERIRNRNDNPLVLVDLGVPRNIDPETAQLQNVHLFNIDNLEDVTNVNLNKREKEVEKIQKIINKKVDEYCSWLAVREAVPVISGLHEKCESIRRMELKKIHNKVNTDTFDIIDLVTSRIVRKLLHNPTVTVRRCESGEARDRLLESIRELFIHETETSGKECTLSENDKKECEYTH